MSSVEGYRVGCYNCGGLAVGVSQGRRGLCGLLSRCRLASLLVHIANRLLRCRVLLWLSCDSCLRSVA
jgi:hypothetical protein